MSAERAQELLNAEMRAQLARRRLPQTVIADALGLAGQTQVSARLRGDVEWKFAELWTVAELFGMPLSRLVALVEASAKPAERSA